MMTINKETVNCTVCPHGTIAPTFKNITNVSSGFLKYFHNLRGKQVKVTIEVLEKEGER